MNQEPLPQIHLIRDTDLSVFAYELHIFAGDFLRECEFNMRSLATNTGADSIAIMGKNHIWLSDALFAYCSTADLYQMILTTEFIGARAFLFHTDRREGGHLYGDVLMMDLDTLRQDIKRNILYPCGVNVERKDGSAATVSLKEWTEMELYEKDALKSWGFSYAPNQVTEWQYHYSTMFRQWMDQAFRYMPQDLEERLNMQYMEAAQNPDMDKCRIPQGTAKQMLLYALMVQPDDILISPREVDEHFGTMVCFHPRYALGDHHNYMDKDDFLREMYLDTVGHDEAGMKRYERMVNIVSSRFRHGPKTEERAIDEAMQKVISEKYLMLPLYLYDHSGLAMSTESFSGRAPHAEWDSGQVGWIYVSKEDALREFDADKMTGAIRQKADALMRSEVAAYDSYLRGECYGFELYKNGELSDSCWGFMGNFSDVLKDMAEYLPDECKGMVDHLEEQERPATIIKTLLKHAKIQVDQAAKAFEHASRQQVLGESR